MSSCCAPSSMALWRCRNARRLTVLFWLLFLSLSTGKCADPESDSQPDPKWTSCVLQKCSKIHLNSFSCAFLFPAVYLHQSSHFALQERAIISNYGLLDRALEWEISFKNQFPWEVGYLARLSFCVQYIQSCIWSGLSWALFQSFQLIPSQCNSTVPVDRVTRCRMLTNTNPATSCLRIHAHFSWHSYYLWK